MTIKPQRKDLKFNSGTDFILEQRKVSSNNTIFEQFKVSAQHILLNSFKLSANTFCSTVLNCYQTEETTCAKKYIGNNSNIRGRKKLIHVNSLSSQHVNSLFSQHVNSPLSQHVNVNSLF